MSSATDHPETVPDAIVDEVRAIREKICEQYGNDVDRLCDHLQDREQTHPERRRTGKRMIGDPAGAGRGVLPCEAAKQGRGQS